MSATLYPGTWDDVEVGPTQDDCIARGVELEEAYRSSWWSEIEGQLWFVQSGIECNAGYDVRAAPAEWSECNASEDDPAPCRHRFCAQDVCPGETDVAVLQGCELEEPCGESFVPSEPDCLWAALRDRTPGRYPVHFGLLNATVDWLLVVELDGSVRATYVELYGFSCTSAIWQPARTCQLAEPQLFDDCIASPAGANCEANTSSFAPWLLDCVDAPASCP